MKITTRISAKVFLIATMLTFIACSKDSEETDQANTTNFPQLVGQWKSENNPNGIFIRVYNENATFSVQKEGEGVIGEGTYRKEKKLLDANRYILEEIIGGGQTTQPIYISAARDSLLFGVGDIIYLKQ